MLSGIKKVVVAPSSGAEIEILHVAPESIFAINEPAQAEAADGTLIYAGKNSRVEIITTDTTLFSQFENFMKDETPLTFYAEAQGGQIYWDEPMAIKAVKKLQTSVGKLVAFSIEFESKSAAAITEISENYFWTDGAGSELADGNGNKIILRKI